MKESPGGIWLIVGALWGLCFLLRAGQAALVRLPDNEVKERGDEPGVYGRIARLLQHPTRFNEAMDFWCWSLTLILWAHLWGALAPMTKNWLDVYSFPQDAGNAAQLVIQVLVGLLTLCLVRVACRLLPKQIGEHLYEQLAPALCDVCNISTILITPLLIVMHGLNRLLSIPFGNEGQEENAVTEEEIRLMVDMGNEKGAIEKSEKDMINNIFAFDDRTVSQVMTHRTDVTALPQDAQLTQVMEVVTGSWYSRIPVYRDSVDNIVGVLYVKDLLSLVGQSQKSFSLDEYTREILFVPENMACRNLFVQFKERKVQIAVVVDEYGGTFGIVTMEDLLESIVGNIQDEYDNEDEDIYQLSKNSYLLKGSLSIADVEQYFDISTDTKEEDEYDTFGGLLVHLLGGLPKPGSHPTITLGGVAFTVAVVENRRIAYLRARRVEEQEQSA